MANDIAQAIVDEARALQKSQPKAAPAWVLDRVMEQGHCLTSPDFSDPTAPGGSWADARTAFGQLLAKVFWLEMTPGMLSKVYQGDGPLPPSAFEVQWRQMVSTRFGQLYGLWSDGKPPEPVAWIRARSQALERMDTKHVMACDDYAGMAEADYETWFGEAGLAALAARPAPVDIVF